MPNVTIDNKNVIQKPLFVVNFSIKVNFLSCSYGFAGLANIFNAINLIMYIDIKNFYMKEFDVMQDKFDKDFLFHIRNIYYFRQLKQA